MRECAMAPVLAVRTVRPHRDDYFAVTGSDLGRTHRNVTSSVRSVPLDETTDTVRGQDSDDETP